MSLWDKKPRSSSIVGTYKPSMGSIFNVVSLGSLDIMMASLSLSACCTGNVPGAALVLESIRFGGSRWRGRIQYLQVPLICRIRY